MLKPLAPAVLGAALAGCTSLTVLTHVPVATMSRLAAFDLAKVDPAVLRVAARLPVTLEPRRNGVKVTLRVADSAGGNGPHTFILAEAAELAELTQLGVAGQAGSRFWVYRLAAADVARIADLRAQALKADKARRASIEAAVDACRRADLPSGPLPTTTYLRTDATGYFVLLQDLDLRAVVSAKQLSERVPPCR
jgi:hypothetical protein